MALALVVWSAARKRRIGSSRLQSLVHYSMYAHAVSWIERRAAARSLCLCTVYFRSRHKGNLAAEEEYDDDDEHVHNGQITDYGHCYVYGMMMWMMMNSLWDANVTSA